MTGRMIGALLGLGGGIAGLAAMAGAMKLGKKITPQHQDQAGQNQAPQEGKRSISLIGRLHEPGEPATAALGRTVYEKVAGRRPDDQTHARLGTAVHWGYGLTTAAAYGAVRAARPRRGADLRGGLAFALGLWLIGDELMVPLLGLSDAPTEHPPQVHLQALIAHVAFGLATAATTQTLAHAVARAPRLR